MTDLRAALELLVTVAEQDLRHGLNASPGLRMAVSQGRAALAQSVTAQKGAREEALERFIESTIRDVCELPDRSSPEDQPEMMLVTGEELEMILRDQLEASGLLSSAIAAGEMREDAERWRALMSSQRVRVMWSAGLARDEAGNLFVRSGGYMHIGVEFWNIHEAAHPSVEYPQERSRETLIFYVDQLRATLSPPKGDET